MTAWQSRGDILRWWRTDVADLSQRRLAEQLGVGRTAITNWEADRRDVSAEDSTLIDRIVEADGVLSGLVWAFGTPDGMAPARVWSNVYPGDSTPVWMWIRSPAPRVAVEAEWGMYRMGGDFELGPNGFFVTVGVSIEQSPVVAQLSEPCWVDFGRGVPPADQIDAPVVDAVEVVRASSAAGMFNDLLSADVTALFQRLSTQRNVELDDDAIEIVETFIDDLDRSTAARTGRPWPSCHDGIVDQDRLGFARLREARRLSLPETVQRLATMTDTHIGRDTLRRFEADQGEPHDELLPAALDHVLGGNGHLAMVEIGSGRGSGAVRCPDYWNAPMWISFEGDTDALHAELEWGRWRRPIEGDLPLTVICHAAMIPLRVVAPDNIRWTVGVGRRRGAIAINHGWVPGSVDTTQEALAHYRQIALDALRHTRRGRRAP